MPRIRGRIRPYKGDLTGKIWSLDFVDYRGKRHQNKFEGTRKQAETQIERIKLKQWALREQIIEGITEITIKDAAARYIKFQQNRNRSNGTIKRFMDGVQGLYSVINPQDLLSGVTVNHLDALENRRLAKIKEVSFKTELRHLRAFFNWAMNYEFIRKSPFAKYVMDLRSRPEDIDKVLTVEDVVRLLVEALRISLEAFHVILLYLDNGFRLSEISAKNFKWEWVSFERCRFQYIDVKSRHPKRKITRRMSDLTYMILTIRKAMSPTAPFTYQPDYYANHYIEPAFRNAGLTGYSAKHLRSTAAGHVYLRDEDIFAAQTFLRHSSVQLTVDSYVGLLAKEKYKSRITLEELFEFCLHNSNKHECKWDQMGESEEAQICGDLIQGLEALLHKLQQDTA